MNNVHCSTLLFNDRLHTIHVGALHVLPFDYVFDIAVLETNGKCLVAGEIA
jgi:hypothetical protein